MIAALLSLAAILYLGFRSASKSGGKSANGLGSSKEDAEKRRGKMVRTPKPEATARSAVQSKGGLTDTAFEDSLKELEELEI